MRIISFIGNLYPIFTVYKYKQQLTPTKMNNLLQRITIRLNESQNYDNNGNPVDREFNNIIEGCTDELEAIQINLNIY